MAIQETIWAGTEQSLQSAIEADDAKTARLSAGQFPDDTSDEEDMPRLLEISGGVAVVSIKGPLNNDASFWNEIFGATGYPEIRDALMVAAEDQSVQQILLDIDSGGGAVSGVEDTAKLIRTINDNVKPVTAYTDGTMASAAYWLGAAAGSVYSGRTAVVGSIGVISTHMERSKMLADAGIGVTVVRSGKFKALANSVEKLTPEGKDQIQQIVDAADAVFVEAIAQMRGKSLDYTRESMAQGREFVGQAGVDVGLVDGISTFDKVMGSLQEAAASNALPNRGISGKGISGTSTTTLQGGADMAKKALTEQDIAALAAGAAIDAKSTETVIDNAQAAVEAVPDPETPAVAAQETQKEVVAEAQKVDTTAATVQLLNEQLKAKDDALIQAHVKISKLEEFKADTEATHGPLLAIAAKSLGNMQIALGGSAINLEGVGAVALLAEHARLTEQFQAKFKVGGVAAVQGDATTTQTQIDPRHKARVNAVRFSK